MVKQARKRLRQQKSDRHERRKESGAINDPEGLEEERSNDEPLESGEDDGNQKDDDYSEAPEEAEESEETPTGAASGTVEKAEVSFDVKELVKECFNPTYHLIDSFLPDRRCTIDRDNLMEALACNPLTSITVVAANDNARTASDAEQTQDIDVLALVSVVDVNANKSRFSSFSPLLDLLQTDSTVVHPGLSVGTLLVPQDAKAPSKALLLINERVSSLPPVLAAQVLQYVTTRLSEANGHMCGTDPSYTVINSVPKPHIVVMAKVQRVASGGTEAGAAPPKKKSKVDDDAAKKNSAFSIEQFAFFREEDELFYKQRDLRVATTVQRFPAQTDEQPEHLVPLCVTFAVSFNAFAGCVRDFVASDPLSAY